ncbi:MAG: hypothetical protein HY608_11615 [Planctomycetes bacterium]|nr:hypothetical protein [Planctomycetota bacterium]
MSGAPDPLYVLARSVLLDTLEALGPQRKAVVLVGAQAVYLHVGESDLAVAPFTTDADIAVDPAALESEPELRVALLRDHPQAGETAREALAALGPLFATAAGQGSRMAARAAAPEPENTITTSCAVLAVDLLRALKS